MGSLFSGIGGFDLAAERLGMRVLWQSEVDRFACRVLAERFPGVENLGDITQIDAAALAPVDVLCGGWPCQGNSVAGKRRGHADERSGLFAEILRLVDGLDPRPRFLCLENVPGLVSVSQGRDFARCIGELRRRGYVGCVRRLDAQYFGLAQRRARLFFVAGLGAEGLRAVQLVLEGGRRYPAPRRATGEGAAEVTGAGAWSESGPGWWRDGLGTLRAEGGNCPSRPSNIVARGDTARYGKGTDSDATDTFVVEETAHALRARSNLAHREDVDTYVTHTLRGEGFDASGGPPTAQVRRLTPTEAERLQGFPDGHTCLCGKNEGRSVGDDPCTCADGPRYRGLGNAVAIPPVAWLLSRILTAAGDLS